MSSDPFSKLNPFEKTVLLEIARAQAFASAAFQAACAKFGEKLPPANEILNTALENSIAGMRETLRNNSGQ